MLYRVHNTGQTVGIRDEDKHLPSRNHFNLSAKVASAAAASGFQRVAGNVFILPTEKGFWSIKEDGKILRLTEVEIESGNHPAAAAPADNPQGFMQDILGDLTL